VIVIKAVVQVVEKVQEFVLVAPELIAVAKKPMVAKRVAAIE
jgi:hypothetical protein